MWVGRLGVGAPRPQCTYSSSNERFSDASVWSSGAGVTSVRPCAASLPQSNSFKSFPSSLDLRILYLLFLPLLVPFVSYVQHFQGSLLGTPLSPESGLVVYQPTLQKGVVAPRQQTPQLLRVDGSDMKHL